MTFRTLLALFITGTLTLSLSGQETLSSAPAGIAPATLIFSNIPAFSGQSSVETKSIAAVAATLNLTDQKLTDAATIINGLTNGVISVIVNLVPPPAALGKTDFSSKPFLSVLQPQIKQLQQTVLATLSIKDVKVVHRFDNIPGFSAEVTAGGLKALQANPQVVLIEPVYLIQPHLAQGIPLIHGMTYRSTYNGAGLAIAICDTGIDYNHARLGGGGFPNGKVLGGYDFGDDDADPIPNAQAHGTCCAGIAAGDLGTVGDYIGGVAYNAKLYALKISAGSTGSATTDAMVAAWDWCVTHKNDNPAYPILVISTSFGGGRFFSTCDSDTPSMTVAANNAVAAGITVLASSGNDGYCDSLAWPACISSVIPVGAVYDAPFGTYQPCINSASCAPTKTANGGCATGYYATDSTAADKVTSYSNMASFLGVLAPGNQCYTLDITGSSGYSSGDYFAGFGGTSAACPYAAGAVASLQSAAKAITGNFLTPAEIRSRLITYGDNVTDTKVAITKPRVNLERAIQSLSTSPILNFASAALAGGNGNQSADPNECSQLTLVIRNDGYSTASNITATLTTTTPGIMVVQPTSSYPDTAAAATATNTTAFEISTSPALVCGTPVNLTLVLSYDGGANTNSFNLSSGSSNYVLTVGSGVIVPGTTDIGNHGDDVVTGIVLPFPFTFYSQTFSNATLSPNGNLQFGSSTGAYSNACLPTATFNYVIAPLWDDLLTSAAGSGIFTSISGSAPNRIFNIEWRATYYSTNAVANFEVRLYESPPRVDLIYGTLNGNGSTTTVGIQKDTGSAFTQFGCNAGVLSAGLQLTFQPDCTDGGGICAMALAGFTASPTNGAWPLTVNFTNLSTGATDFTWDFGDGQTSTNLNPSNVYSSAGSYTVSLAAVGSGMTNSLALPNFIIVTNPPPLADFAAGTTSGIRPLTVSFTNLSSDATSFAWDFGDGNTSTDLNPTNIYSVAGTYTVMLTAMGAGGTNQSVRANYIVVNEPPPVADFVADNTNGTAPLTVNFTNRSSGASNYNWDFADGNLSTDLNPQNIFTNAGTYTVTLTAIGPGGTNTLVLTNFIVAISPPLLLVSQAGLDFGLVVTGATLQATLVVSNAGGATLDGTALVDGEPFAIVDLLNGSVSNSVFSLAGLSSTNLVLRFAPTMEGAFTNAVALTSNGGNATNALTGRSVGIVLLGQTAASGTDFTFSFATVPGINYFVEYKDSLTDPTWQPLQSVPGDGTVQTVTNSIPAATQRYFRVDAQ